MNVRKFLLIPILAVLIGSTLSSVAQEALDSDRSGHQADYYFLFGLGLSELDLSFRDNGAQFDRMMSTLSSIVGNQGVSVDRIVLRSSASVDGALEQNERLWSKRAEVVRDRIVSSYPELLSKIRIHPKGEDWTGLYEAVLDNPDVPNRQQAADIIAMSSTISSRKYFLRQLDNGTTWRYISKKILPTLRTASVAIFYSDNQGSEAEVVLAPLIVTDPVDYEQASPLTRVIRDTIVIRDTLSNIEPMVFTPFVESPVLSMEYGPRMSLKTNLIYLLGLQANVEAEFYFARRWSLNLEAQVAWWSLPEKHIHYRYANFSPEARYWFRNDESFTGHYVGLAISGGLYELSLGLPRNNYEGYQGEFGTVSITYGHMWHIKNNFYIEAGLGVGYLFTGYRRYQHLDTHNVYQGTERLQVFTPTKLKVNLVWRLGKGNRKR